MNFIGPLPDLTSRLMPDLRDAAREAGRMALDFFRPGGETTARIWSKAGGSPVTEADVAVDVFLKIRLSRLWPEAGWVSEETADDQSRLRRRLVWIVDPIDGTRAFLSGHPDWSVAIALLSDGYPLLGVVAAPALGTFYEAVKDGGAFKNGERISVSGLPILQGARIAGPKFMADRLERGAVVLQPKIPSLALRLARVAEGAIDVGLVSANARDWDLAAADLILAEAGGILSDLSGQKPRYNRQDTAHGELLASPRPLHPALIAAMKQN